MNCCTGSSSGTFGNGASEIIGRRSMAVWVSRQLFWRRMLPFAVDHFSCWGYCSSQRAKHSEKSPNSQLARRFLPRSWTVSLLLPLSLILRPSPHRRRSHHSGLHLRLATDPQACQDRSLCRHYLPPFLPPESLQIFKWVLALVPSASWPSSSSGSWSSAFYL